MNRAQKGTRIRNAAMIAGVLVLLLSGAQAQADQVFNFANGIRASIHTDSDITSQLQEGQKGMPVLVHPAVGSLELVETDQELFPFQLDQVVQALEQMQGFVSDLDVEIFLLPAVPAEVGGSYASRSVIYLAPGTGPIDPETSAYIVTHEMGHVLTWAFLDGHTWRWDDYMDLRGLDPVLNGPTAAHADRAREILAEDFRFLFGGSLATASGSIENHDLATPDRVFGLQDLLQSFVESSARSTRQASSKAFPNPCNPQTTIEMNAEGLDYAAGASAVLRIYDVRGSLVRTISGGYQTNGLVSIQWDGTDGSGSAAASGQYLYLMQLGELSARGSVTLIR